MDLKKTKKPISAGTKMFAAKVFGSFRPLIKDWVRFLQTTETLIGDFLEEDFKTNISITSETEFALSGRQIGSEPPDYEEYDINIPDEVRINSSIKIKYTDLIKDWTQKLRSNLKNPKEFQKHFFLELSKNRTFRDLFIKLVRAILITEVKKIDGGSWADISNLDAYLEKEMIYTPSVIDVVDSKTKLKNISHNGSYLEVLTQTDMDLEIEVEGDDMGRYASKWESLPKGWTQESLKKFWSSLTGGRKHKVTACINKMEGKIDNPGAFCASLNDKIDPGWRTRNKKKANQLAARWMMKQAQEPVTLNHYLKPIDRLPGMIFQDLLKIQHKDQSSKNVKPYVCGFIVSLFDQLRPKDPQLSKITFNLFERSGPGVIYGDMLQVPKTSQKYLSTIRRNGNWLAASAVSLELLKKARLQTERARLESILTKTLAAELAGTTQVEDKFETPTQVLKRLVQKEMPAAKGLLYHADKDPRTVRAYVADILEDANEHRLAGQLWVEPNGEIQRDIVSSIAQDHGWDLESLAVFGLASLSLVKDRAGVSIIKKYIKNEFPNWLKENAQIL